MTRKVFVIIAAVALASMALVIVLERSRPVHWNAADTQNILHNKPYVMPKLSIAMRIVPTIKSRGVDAGIEEYERLKVTQPETFDFSDESELNSLGYQLLSEGQVQAAVQLFDLNTREFPASSNAYDSLGEAYSKAGKKDRAIEAYTKAIELDPNNLNSRKMLRRLE